MSLLGYTEKGDKIIGVCPFDFSGRPKTTREIETEHDDFSTMNAELKREYGSKNVWFDRDRENNRILFLTNG